MGGGTYKIPGTGGTIFNRPGVLKKAGAPTKHKVLSPMGRSDHVVLEINLKDWEISKDEEDHKNGRFNYAKGNFTELRKFLGSINWKALMEGKIVQEKYEAFLINTMKVYRGMYHYIK